MYLVLATIIALSAVVSDTATVPVNPETDVIYWYWVGEVYVGLNGDPEDVYIEVYNSNDQLLVDGWADENGEFSLNVTSNPGDDVYVKGTYNSIVRIDDGIDYPDDYVYVYYPPATYTHTSRFDFTYHQFP